MRLSPRLLFFALPYFMRAPMKVKIVIGVAVLGFLGWTYLGKSKGGNFPGSSAEQSAPLSQGQRP